MAVLHHPATGVRHRLRGRHVVGRAPGVDLVLEHPRVSREHATLAWSGDGWFVKDLGSRNGTFVAGQRLERGSARALRKGDVVAFGGEAETWTLADDAPPGVAATAPDRVVLARDGLLLLPDAADPEVVVHEEHPAVWVVEEAEGPRRISDRDTVVAAGITWTLHVPAHLPSTHAAEEGRTLPATSWRFAVSADEEHVEVAVGIRGETHALAPRAHHEILLALARQRIDDAEAGLPAAEQGWVYADDLQKMLRVSANQVYVGIHRARKELEPLGISGATDLVQRRPRARQLRFGVADVSVAAL